METVSARNRRFFLLRTTDVRETVNGVATTTTTTPAAHTPEDELTDVRNTNQLENYHYVRNNVQEEALKHAVNTHIFEDFSSSKTLLRSLRNTTISFLEKYDITIPTKVNQLVEHTITAYLELTNTKIYKRVETTSKSFLSSKDTNTTITMAKMDDSPLLSDRINDLRRINAITKNKVEQSFLYFWKRQVKPDNVNVDELTSDELIAMARNGTLFEENVTIKTDTPTQAHKDFM